MANDATLPDLYDFLAGVCEILKRHEQEIVDLNLDALGLKAALAGAERERFQRARDSAAEEKAAEDKTGDTTASQSRWLEEGTEWLRGEAKRMRGA